MKNTIYSFIQFKHNHLFFGCFLNTSAYSMFYNFLPLKLFTQKPLSLVIPSTITFFKVLDILIF